METSTSTPATATGTATPGATGSTPDAPTGVTGAAAEGQVTLFWAIPGTDGGSPITGYKIYVSDGSTVDVGSAATSAVVGGLTNGVAYTFTVSAVNAVGEGPRSDPSMPITPFSLPPDPSTIAPPVNTTVATNIFSSTAFLYTGSDPIQTGVAPGTITLTRTAVLRGEVLDRNGDSLPGVAITVLDHPEFGQTVSRADGMYDLVVNGGGLLTLTYTAQGYLPAQRQVQAPWQDYAQVQNVALVPYDPHVNVVQTGASTEQVAQGGMQQDADGSRQATLLFAPDTTASMTMPDGSARPLPGPWHVRATEFTVGAMGPTAMPAALPATSGYTYAADFSLDEAVAAGATGVQFSTPVTLYVQNFIGFPVGNHVPTGYYDRTAGHWVAVPDGRVVKILSIAGGSAALDVDGNGTPATAAELQALGITSAELAMLAQTYAGDVGQSFWRVLITHFSSWDSNWGYGPPPNAPAPPGPGDPNGPNNPSGPGGPCQNTGSIIGCQDQTLGEAVPLAGTPFTLHYISNRVPGWRDGYTLHIPVVGDSVPQILKRAELSITIAGRVFTLTWPASDLSPHQQYTFTWDGRDAYGRTLQGLQPYRYDLAYVYTAVYYQTPAQQASSFAAYSGMPVTAHTERGEIYIHIEGHGAIGSLAQAANGLGGWSLDAHNIYDPTQHTLFQGDGTQRSAVALAPVINGSPTNPYYCEQCGLIGPTGVADAPDGSIYYLLADGEVVRQLPDGATQLIRPSNPFDRSALGFALGPDGSLYEDVTTSTGARVVQRIAPDGTTTTVAGGGSPADNLGDNGPATQALLANPSGLAVSPDGSLYIADAGMSRVRRVAPDGTISTVAGTGTLNGAGSYGGDGGPAAMAQLDEPSGIALGPDGSLYVADTFNNRIRRISADGIITTVAGNGQCPAPNSDGSDVGEGGPATQARLCHPTAVTVAADGTLYLSTVETTSGSGAQIGVVRAVLQDGTLLPVAGRGTCDVLNPDTACNGGLAANALFHPGIESLSVAPDGSLTIADGYEGGLYHVAAAFPGLGVGTTYIPSENGRQIFVFDDTGRQLATLDALTNGMLYNFTYDNEGHLSQIIDGAGNTTTIQHDGAGDPTAIIAPGGQRTTLTVDANGYLASISDPLGNTTRLTSTTDGLLTSLTTPNGALHQFSYDAEGLLTRDQGPDGTSTSLARIDGTGIFTVTVTTALGTTTSYVVEHLADGSSRQTRIDPGGAHTVITYGLDGSQTALYPDGSRLVVQQAPDPRWGMAAPVAASITATTPGGKVTTITNTRSAVLSAPGNPLSLSSLTVTSSLNGALTTTSYSAPTRAITIVTAAGRRSTSTLDGLGRVVSWQPDTSLSPITYSYNAQGQLLKAQQDSQYETYTYDAANDLAGRTNATGQVWQYRYDADGNLTALTLPGGEVYRLGYDADGNETSITMPNGSVHSLQYTALDDPGAYIPPGSTAGFAHAYDAEQRLATATLPDGRISTRGYDIADRPSTLQYPEATISYSYTANDTNDPVSTLLRTPSAIGTAETLNFGYDGSVETSSSLTGAAVGQFSYGYNSSLLLNAISVQSGSDAVTIPVGHDADGLMTAFGPLSLARSGPLGQQSSASDGTAMRIDETYDTLGELTSRVQTVQGTTILSDSYSYDAAGRISQVVEQVGGATHTYTYTYNTDGQLMGVDEDGATIQQYAYDANGNRISKALSGAPAQTATYDTRDRLQALGGTLYSFDASGFLTARGSDTFTYSTRGELLQAIVGGATVTYSYDGLGRRVSRTDSSGATQYLYGNPADPFQVSAVRDPAGVLTVLYYDASGALVAFDRGGSRYYVGTDAVGTPRVVTNAAGIVVKALTYSSYGDLLADSAPAFALPIGYAGGLTDAVTGLVHFGFRDYDPGAGRWTAIDPALYDGGQGNLYAYANDDPVDFRDPTGLFCMGGSAYDAVGGGVQLCYDDKGFSLCAELGLGVGESTEVNPLGSIADNGISLVGEAQISYGLGTASTSVTLTPCQDTPLYQQGQKSQADAKLTLFGEGLKGSLTTNFDPDGNGTTQFGLDTSDNKYGLDDLGHVGIEGKLADQFCGNLPWSFLN